MIFSPIRLSNLFSLISKTLKLIKQNSTVTRKLKSSDKITVYDEFICSFVEYRS